MKGQTEIKEPIDKIKIHYDKKQPEAYVWLHIEDYAVYKEWCREQEMKLCDQWICMCTRNQRFSQKDKETKSKYLLR